MNVRGVPRRVLILLPLAAAGCATGAAVSENFPQLRYNYLPKLRLSVASIEIENAWQPSGDVDHLESLSPETPLAALRQMAKDRLAAYGTSGKAVFVIEDASLVKSDSELIGSFAVRLNVYSANGTKSGFAEARVSETEHAPSGEGSALRQALYDLTRRIMNTMNVEFEYQLRRSLGEWLVHASATPAVIEAKPLGPPGAAAPPAGSGTSRPPRSSPTPRSGVLGTLPVAPAKPQPNP
ncbi:MAG: hypothetical protein M0002_08755 [Rhodospirillales bacterium]|nr:hypothetical protein [Rhodospirillales bacterium]